MASHYDVIVVGLGAMGSAAAYHLAASGQRVLGLDRFEPPHNLGSSHGLTRIIREAYFEHPLYVPLVQRAYQLWNDLERASGRRLYLQTGGVLIGPSDSALVTGAKRSAAQHNLAHEVLSADELRRRFAVFAPTKDMVAVWEPRAGILFPESAIQIHLELAAKCSAHLQYNESVVAWEPDGEAVRVVTSSSTYRAGKMIIAAGAWMTTLIPALRLPLTVERQVLFWFEPESQPEQFDPQRCPIHIWEYEPRRFFYGFPDLGDGAKVAVHHQGQKCQPDAVRREVAADELKTMRELLRRFLPAANGKLKSAVVCMYTNTPDEHFLLDWHPQHPQVLIASPCSGHGFKFSSVIGEIAATMLNGRRPEFDLSMFRLERFAEGK
jgi:sarcosine oxidase